MSAVFEVAFPGMLSTLQDLGRAGYQRDGVPVSGAMDPFALQAGNLLVGNERGAAGLEIAMHGPSLRATAECLVCVAGAGATLVDGTAVPAWKSFPLRPGQEIVFQGSAQGVWSYLCVAGGFDVPVVMGSRSTCLRAGFGGLAGRALKAGDLLEAGPTGTSARPGRWLKPGDIPLMGSRAEVRTVPGPQDGLFTSRALQRFHGSDFTVTPASNRMGYQLRGERLECRPGPDILSDGVAFGSVQIPPNGQPIVLMADRQTTGGYAKIATVASVDVPRIAQLPAGGIVAFRRAEVDEAQEAALRQEEFLARLEEECRA